MSDELTAEGKPSAVFFVSGSFYSDCCSGCCSDFDFCSGCCSDFDFCSGYS